MKLYAITDRRLFASLEALPPALIDKAALWASGGVDFVQVREKDLAPAELYELACRIVRAVRSTGGHTRVLLNGSVDGSWEMAAATGCDGVHLAATLPGSAIADARMVMMRAVPDSVISVSCHTVFEVERARDEGATLALFAPVFEKRSGAETVPGQGLQALAEACRVAAPMPVFALGGVTVANAQDCIHAGAAGIAAIRLFAFEDWLAL